MDIPFNVTIAEQPYQLEIWMSNQLSQYVPLKVHPLLIHSLNIEETLTNWWVNGWIIFNNEMEILERGNPNNLSKASQQTVIANIDPLHALLSTAVGAVDSIVNPQAPFLFRTDARNRISIRFYPVNPTSNNSELAYPKKQWELSFDCVIYDIEDLPSENNIQKRRKFYFRSEIYQYFVENNIEFSTSTSTQAKDEERVMPANLALKNLITQAAKFQPGGVKIGYDSKGSIESPNVKLDTFSESLWDIGPEKDNRIFYTSPANSSILDDSTYISQHLQAAEGGPVIMEYGRSSQDKFWSLVPLAQLFKDASDNQVERVILHDVLESTTPYQARAPEDSVSNIKNFVSGVASVIYSYRFVPMTAQDDLRIVNRPLHYYDFASGSFKVKIKNNTAQKVVDNLKSMASKGLYSHTSGRGQILLNVNLTKSSGRTTVNEFLSTPYNCSSLPANNMLLDALYLNEALYFTAPGLTIRTPGKFLNVDRIAATVSNPKHPFDDRFLGQWLITKVSHYINPAAGAYSNEVLATKVDSFAKLWPTVETKF